MGFVSYRDRVDGGAFVRDLGRILSREGEASFPFLGSPGGPSLVVTIRPGGGSYRGDVWEGVGVPVLGRLLGGRVPRERIEESRIRSETLSVLSGEGSRFASRFDWG